MWWVPLWVWGWGRGGGPPNRSHVCEQQRVVGGDAAARCASPGGATPTLDGAAFLCCHKGVCGLRRARGRQGLAPLAPQVSLMEDANMCAIHAKRVTIM